MFLGAVKFPIAFGVLVLLASCEVFDPRAEVPAYLSLEGFETFADSASQGTDKQNISDAWVYLNDQLQGVYELPAKVPVIADGKYTLRIYPGIKVNGIAATRAPYSFLTYHEEPGFVFSPGVTSRVLGKTTYRAGLNFVWMENFESQGISLVKGLNSDTTFNVVNGGPASFNGSRFGQVVLDGTKTRFQINSFRGFKLPKDGSSATVMELHYNITSEMTVGLIANQPGNTSVNPLVTLKPTNGNWKKVYINFTDLVNTFRAADDYSIFFAASRSDISRTDIYSLDNIKLIHE